jgi:hypothetical protein
MHTMTRFVRSAWLGLLAVSLAACGDSTGPRVLTLEQVEDMLEAMTEVQSLGVVPGANLAVVTVSETVDCPNGGSATVNGSVDDHGTTTSATVAITQSFSGCKSTSSRGRVWTFDGDPNIATNLSVTSNPTTQAFTITGTQVGGVRFSSDLGSGSCAINLNISFSGDEDSFEASINGTACGHNIQQSISITS